MRAGGGQAIVELALVLPPLLALALGTVEAARVADAREGLDSATAAAATAAARAPDAASAASSATGAFTATVAAYPLENPSLSLDLGSFSRGASATASGTATVRLDFLPVPGLPARLPLTATTTARIEAWRSR